MFQCRISPSCHFTSIVTLQLPRGFVPWSPRVGGGRKASAPPNPLAAWRSLYPPPPQPNSNPPKSQPSDRHVVSACLDTSLAFSDITSSIMIRFDDYVVTGHKTKLPKWWIMYHLPIQFTSKGVYGEVWTDIHFNLILVLIWFSREDLAEAKKSKNWTTLAHYFSLTFDTFTAINAAFRVSH